VNLTAHPIGRDDFSVLDDGHAVGRIRLAAERTPAAWIWNVNIPVPIPAWCNGSAPDRKTAMARFREAWTRFKLSIGPEAYAAAIAEAAAASARFADRE
jgi:hypothetical protein